MEKLPIKALVKLKNVFSASFRLKYDSRCCKVAEIIMIPKQGKLVKEILSYNTTLSDIKIIYTTLAKKAKTSNWRKYKISPLISSNF